MEARRCPRRLAQLLKDFNQLTQQGERISTEIRPETVVKFLMGLFGGCYVADGPEAEERHPEMVADLSDSRRLHVAGKSVGIEGFDFEILFE